MLVEELVERLGCLRKKHKASAKDAPGVPTAAGGDLTPTRTGRGPSSKLEANTPSGASHTMSVELLRHLYVVEQTTAPLGSRLP